MRIFYFHYNKPASLKAGKVKMSVHFMGKCHIVDAVRCLVPCETRIKKRQPRCVMAGMADSVLISGNKQSIAVIV